ncbi:unnamed protein product [Notodromas monacha]|uniref:Macoilin n=1 Tax=Notodromas monacha TaxID=399045 RepID=A0A7R9GBW6_9CRUS|nr:unnamed protein product [Notodromas monacha]CAG0916834.1 unnamed protein product [Notodromas monacha]
MPIAASTFLYVRFLMIWVIVLLGDFFLEFRFEYLWPFWLLIRSLYDSYRYQGLAFCVFFMCVALTSDMVCLLFMPAQWLFFVASTYVWVQLVWQTERGVCLPTICLWLLFIYIEASVRLRDFQKTLPFHLDLCRPFAAHCIGYPVVTLGFGVKSYVSYRVRQRRQKDVERENEFYVQLLQGALPPEMQYLHQRDMDAEQLTQSVMSEQGFVQRFEEAPVAVSTGVSVTSNGVLNGIAHHNHQSHHNHASSRSSSKRGAHKIDSPFAASKADFELMEQRRSSWKFNGVSHGDDADLDKSSVRSGGRSRSSSAGRVSIGKGGFKSPSWMQDDGALSSSSSSSSSTTATAPIALSSPPVSSAAEPNNNTQVQTKKNKHRDAQTAASKDEANYQLYVARLECDVKRLKAELSSTKGNESDLSGKLQTVTAAEKGVRMELNLLQSENESLQSRLQTLVAQRQQDKQTIAQMERKLHEERKLRLSSESQLNAERKAAAVKERLHQKQQAEEQQQMQAQAQARAQNRSTCGDACKQKLRDAEAEMKQTRAEIKIAEERRRQLERDLQNLRRRDDEKEMLLSALASMKEKHAHLEQSLSAETKLKLELFSALGDAKRQLAAKHGILQCQEKEINDLKSKIAEVLAVMPSHQMPSPQQHMIGMVSPQLDPNARIYSPPGSSLQHSIQIPVSAAHSAIFEALDGHVE